MEEQTLVRKKSTEHQKDYNGSKFKNSCLQCFKKLENSMPSSGSFLLECNRNNYKKNKVRQFQSTSQHYQFSVA
jgi:hypothetical protein